MFIILKEKQLFIILAFYEEQECVWHIKTFSNYSVHITGLSIIKKQKITKCQNMWKQLEYIMIPKRNKTIFFK